MTPEETNALQQEIRSNKARLRSAIASKSIARQVGASNAITFLEGVAARGNLHGEIDRLKKESETAWMNSSLSWQAEISSNLALLEKITR